MTLGIVHVLEGQVDGAVEEALASLRIHHVDMPLTAEKVWPVVRAVRRVDP